MNDSRLGAGIAGGMRFAWWNRMNALTGPRSGSL